MNLIVKTENGTLLIAEYVAKTDSAMLIIRIDGALKAIEPFDVVGLQIDDLVLDVTVESARTVAYCCPSCSRVMTKFENKTTKTQPTQVDEDEDD